VSGSNGEILTPAGYMNIRIIRMESARSNNHKSLDAELLARILPPPLDEQYIQGMDHFLPDCKQSVEGNGLCKSR
jgi:hypothetical protein